MSGGYTAPRLLAVDDHLEGFDSGEPELDQWLIRQAQRNQTSGGSRTYVTTRNGRVVGYYSLATASVLHAHASGKVRRNQPNPIPVILLGRLAVDRKDQGRGLGAHLLRDAIIRTVQAANIVGVRALLVHALHEQARQFYHHFDFEPSPTDSLHLFLLIKDVATGR
jgi:GNAT superfamily N-acetyltransferase